MIRSLLGTRGSEGFSMPIAMVAALLLLIGMAALGTRSSQGFLASADQGVNREARDVAESAITDFAVTLNREENRRLLVAGNEPPGQSSWSSNSDHRNPCSGAFDANGKYQPNTALTTTADRFVPGETWRDLLADDNSRQFKVEEVKYLYVHQSKRVEYNFDTPDQNIEITDGSNNPLLTVREVALQGGTRTLLRVTIQGRVVRNGQTSLARVTREFEVVPKCCKRSFGRHSGLGAEVGAEDSAPAWGTDPVLECPQALDDGIGRGIIGSLNGGEPSGSNNTLDIVDERNNLVTRALCWGGNLGSGSDLNGTPNPDCISGEQALGKASKSKPGVTFVPAPFDLVLPRPRFGDAPGSGSGPDGGWIAQQSGVQAASEVASAFPGATFGNWVTTNSGKIWLKTFPSNPNIPSTGWRLFDTQLVTTPSFAGCTGAVTDIGFCRSEPFFGSAGPYPKANSQTFNQWATTFPRPTLTISGDTTIYLDPADLTMKRKTGSSVTVMDNCIVTKTPSAPYAVADCRFRDIASGNQTLKIDTTYAMINFHFDDPTYSGEYMGGNGNTTIQRVQCSRNGYVAGSCNIVVTWSAFQRKCDPAAGSTADANCSSRNDYYDHSELFNAFGHGPGSFELRGTASTVGMNIYAPRASVELIGGGNAEPNFMGRIWSNDIAINGNTKVRTPVTNPSFCANHRCPPPSRIPLYDMVARSVSHASGF